MRERNSSNFATGPFIAISIVRNRDGTPLNVQGKTFIMPADQNVEPLVTQPRTHLTQRVAAHMGSSP